MSLRTTKDFANYKEFFAKQQEQEQYNSEPERLKRANEKLIQQIDEEQRALSLHESSRGRRDPHLNLPLPKFGKWTAQEIEDRVSMSWSIFKADHLTAKNLALSPKGYVVLGALMDQNPGDYSRVDVIQQLFDRALRTGALQMNVHVIDTAEPAPAPEPEWTPEPEPAGLPAKGRERDAWTRRQARAEMVQELTTSPAWVNTIQKYIGRTADKVLATTEAQRQLFDRVSRTREGFTESSIERCILALWPEAATTDQREALADEKLSSEEYLRKKNLRVANFGSQVFHTAIRQPQE